MLLCICKNNTNSNQIMDNILQYNMDVNLFGKSKYDNNAKDNY